MPCRPLAALIALMIVLAVSSAAAAAEYTVHACELPSGDSAPAAGFHAALRGPSNYQVDCYAVGMHTEVAHGNDQGVDLTFDAPLATTIDGYTLWRWAEVHKASTYNYAYELFEGAGGSSRTLIEHCYGQQGCGSVGDSRQTVGERNRFTRADLANVRQIQLRVRCLVANGTCPATAPSRAAVAVVNRADITLRDDTVPVLSSAPSGTLLDGSRPLTGVQQVSLAATDAGGGVYQAQFEVDGEVVDAQTLDDNEGRCVPPFSDPVPCRLSASATFDFDTTALSDGEHTLRILVTDATGTNAAIYGPVRITTTNSTCTLDATPDAPFKLTTTLSRRRVSKARTVRYRQKVRLYGRLVTNTGEPIVGEPVCIGARIDAAGAGVTALGTATTDAAGRFTYDARADSSRRIRVTHQSAEGAVVASSVRLRVGAPVSLHVSRRTVRTGQRVVLSGLVRGRPIPSAGLLVELQSRRPERWQTFRSARTDRRGRFRAGYRFTRTLGVPWFRLRARVPRQAGFPYATGSSKAVRLRVHG
ncbi:MAG: hypothetical protein V7607_5461 [Solirubrobacteraceae bacterium]